LTTQKVSFWHLKLPELVISTRLITRYLWLNHKSFYPRNCQRTNFPTCPPAHITEMRNISWLVLPKKNPPITVSQNNERIGEKGHLV
jgi:hypothetical protein